MSEANREIKSTSVFDLLLIAAAGFFLGGIIGHEDLPPFPDISTGFDNIKSIHEDVIGAPPNAVRPLRYTGLGLVRSEPKLFQDGLLLVQGWVNGRAQLIAFDRAGSAKHKWQIDFFSIWPDAKSKFSEHRVPTTNMRVASQGFYAFPDGSVLVNLNNFGIAKLDRCGQVVWRHEGHNHHSITPAGNGTFWVPGGRSTQETRRELLPWNMSGEDIDKAAAPRGNNYHDVLQLIDQEGQVLREISLLEAIFIKELEGSLYSSISQDWTDPTHLNDIEIVTAPLAEKIPGSKSGDLLVSLRSMNMLAIISEDSGSIVWHKSGPWIRQHDPDITSDGKIETFNNRTAKTGLIARNSEILVFDPESSDTKTIYPTILPSAFFTPYMGEHQALENGNRLIVESTAGRLFEVSPEGKVVWDLRLRFDDKHAALITSAKYLPLNYFEESLVCNNEQN